MKFYGNYKHLIKQEWIDLLLSSKGHTISPFDDHIEQEENIKKEISITKTTASSEKEIEMFEEKGIYGPDLIIAEMYTNRNNPFELDLGEFNPLMEDNWWIVKQMPGQFMPLHRDVLEPDNDHIRIWMPWYDYQPGHIFIHEGKFVKDYKAGDMWIYNDVNDLHGSANISLTPRIVLQLTLKKII